MAERSYSRRQAVLMIVAATLLWSIPALAIKYLTGYMDLASQNLVRFVSASAVLWAVCLVRARGEAFSPGLLVRVLPAFAVVMIYQLLYTRAFYMRDVLPGIAYMLTKSTVFITAALSCLFFADERRVVRDRKFQAGAALSVAGLGIFLAVSAASSSGTAAGSGGTLFIGVLLILASAVFWALYTVLVKMLVRKGSPLVMYTYICTLMTLVFAGMKACGVTLGEGPAHFDVPAGWHGAWVWTVAISSGALCVGASHVLYYYSIRTIGTTVCGTVTLSNTFLPPLLSVFMFGEHFNGWHVLAGGLLVAGAAFTLQAEPVESEQQE